MFTGVPILVRTLISCLVAWTKFLLMKQNDFVGHILQKYTKLFCSTSFLTIRESIKFKCLPGCFRLPWSLVEIPKLFIPTLFGQEQNGNGSWYFSLRLLNKVWMSSASRKAGLEKLNLVFLPRPMFLIHRDVTLMEFELLLIRITWIGKWKSYKSETFANMDSVFSNPSTFNQDKKILTCTLRFQFRTNSKDEQKILSTEE